MHRNRWLSVALGAAALAMLVSSTAHAAPADAGQPWDFDGDGYPEMVTAHPAATVDGMQRAGAVAVFAGTPDGPTRTDPVRLVQGSGHVPGSAESSARFGNAVTSGDYDADGYADLAVCTSGARSSVGHISVLFGGPDGFAAGVALNLPDLGIGCRSSATSDMDQDGYDDLVLGGGELGWAAGSADARDQENWPVEVLDRSTEEGVSGIAAGDLTGDGRPDLAYTLFGSEQEAYLRTMLSGPTGHTAGDGKRYLPAQLRVAVGDVDGDGVAELAVGNSGTARHRGRVEVFPGRASGPDLDGDRREINQSTSGVPGTGEDNDEFGDSVSLRDADDDGYADLAVGVPGEDIGSVVDAGRIVTIPGRAGGLATGQTTGINQGTPGIPGSVERGDEFGGYVDYRDGTAAGAVGLVVGAPGEDAGEGRTYLLGADDTWWFKPGHAGIEMS